jgi:histone deacetylase complex regulatory component SIN3
MQNQQQQKLSRELKVEDALLYLDQVRVKYHSNYEIILIMHMHVYIITG